MKNNKEKLNLLLRVIFTGLVAAGLFYVFFFLASYFSFIHKNILGLIPGFNKLDQVSNLYLKAFLNLSLIATISILTSLIYYTFLRPFANIWVGVAFGFLLFLFFLMVLIFVDKDRVFSSDYLSSFVTIGGIFVLYGSFTGYSISFDYVETSTKDPSQP